MDKQLDSSNKTILLLVGVKLLSCAIAKYGKNFDLSITADKLSKQLDLDTDYIKSAIILAQISGVSKVFM